jgi:hypothetical protein
MYADLVESVGHEFIQKANAENPEEEPMALEEYVDFTNEIIEIICQRYEDIQQSCYDCAKYDIMDVIKTRKEFFL